MLLGVESVMWQCSSNAFKTIQEKRMTTSPVRKENYFSNTLARLLTFSLLNATGLSAGRCTYRSHIVWIYLKQNLKQLTLKLNFYFRKLDGEKKNKDI